MAKASKAGGGVAAARSSATRSSKGGDKASSVTASSYTPARSSTPASSDTTPSTTHESDVAGADQTGSDQGGKSAIEALKQDHRRVEGLFAEFAMATEEQRKRELISMICAELNIHTRLEEEIFYPACREAIEDDDEDIMDEAQVEHDAAKLLLADLSQASTNDRFLDAKVKLLSEQIKHHVAEEEKSGEGIFGKAEEKRSWPGKSPTASGNCRGALHA